MPPLSPPELIDTDSTLEREILDLRSIGMRRALALGRFHYHRAHPAPNPPMEQQHPHWMVLVFGLSGTQHYLVDGCKTVIRGGELLRVLPGQRYGTGDWPEAKGRLAWLILKLRPAPRGSALGMSATNARAVFEMLADPSRPQVLPQPTGLAGVLHAVFDQWAHRHSELGTEIIRNHIASLVLTVAQATVNAAPANDNGANTRRIERVLEWIDVHREQSPTSQSLAQLAGLSPARFHVHFKRITGCSPKDYLLRKRVERAAEQLQARPELTVTAVAHALGFANSQHFATVFRRYLGMSPTEFRKLASSSGAGLPSAGR